MAKYLVRFAIIQVLAHGFAAAAFQKLTVDLDYAIYRPTVVKVRVPIFE